MQFEGRKWTSKLNLCLTNSYNQNENIECLKILFNNRIRATLKIVRTPLHLSFNVAFQTNTFRGYETKRGRLIFSSHFVTFLDVT